MVTYEPGFKETSSENVGKVDELENSIVFREKSSIRESAVLRYTKNEPVWAAEAIEKR